MIDNNNFYVFEVTEDYHDSITCYDNGMFYKHQRFIGWETTAFDRIVKSNTSEMVSIPRDKVKKLYKVRFEEIEE